MQPEPNRHQEGATRATGANVVVSRVLSKDVDLSAQRTHFEQNEIAKKIGREKRNDESCEKQCERRPDGSEQTKNEKSVQTHPFARSAAAETRGAQKNVDAVVPLKRKMSVPCFT